MGREQPDVLIRLAENEEAIGTLYGEYAARFPDYAGFWYEMAGDEAEHAGWLRGLSSGAGPGGLPVDENRFNLRAIETYMKYLQEELDRVRRGETPLLNALSVTLYLEESLMERKYFEVLEADSQGLKRVLRDLSAATASHVARAREALDRYKQTASSG